MKAFFLTAAIAAAAIASPAAAGSIASVSLSGGNFLQAGSVFNNAASTANIIKVVYSLGTPDDNIATWDSGAGGGTASDFLSNPQFFQTVTFDGLSIAAGATFNFGGLDIDLILTLVPLSVTGGVLDEDGSSLRNAYVSVFWSDGSSGTGELNETAWRVDQAFRIGSEDVAVPEPGMLGLLGFGVLGLAAAKRRRRG